jgi:hypothetical protein
MPDVTVSFTDAQWARIVAVSSSIKNGITETGDVDADYIAARWKTELSTQVQNAERAKTSIDDF